MFILGDLAEDDLKRLSYVFKNVYHGEEDLETVKIMLKQHRIIVDYSSPFESKFADTMNLIITSRES